MTASQRSGCAKAGRVTRLFERTDLETEEGVGETLGLTDALSVFGDPFDPVRPYWRTEPGYTGASFCSED
jgi:hypothetical protein